MQNSKKNSHLNESFNYIVMQFPPNLLKSPETNESIFHP